jgi:hypothetical protein
MDRALQMRAALAVSRESLFRQTDENAGVIFSRVAKEFVAARGDFIETRDGLRLAGNAWTRPAILDKPTRAECQRRSAREFRKLPARHAMFLRLANRIIAFPIWHRRGVQSSRFKVEELPQP